VHARKGYCPKELKGKVAIVTGAGSGIGRAIALKLVVHSADIVSPGSIATGMALAEEGTAEFEEYSELIR